MYLLGLDQCVHDGVRYLPCIVPMAQWSVCQDCGAVPIAQVAAADLSNGVLPPDRLAHVMSTVGENKFPGSVVSVNLSGVLSCHVRSVR